MANYLDVDNDDQYGGHGGAEENLRWGLEPETGDGKAKRSVREEEDAERRSSTEQQAVQEHPHVEQRV